MGINIGWLPMHHRSREWSHTMQICGNGLALKQPSEFLVMTLCVIELC